MIAATSVERYFTDKGEHTLASPSTPPPQHTHTPKRARISTRTHEYTVCTQVNLQPKGYSLRGKTPDTLHYVQEIGVDFRGVSFHVGFYCNELSDEFAKRDALKNESQISYNILLLSPLEISLIPENTIFKDLHKYKYEILCLPQMYYLLHEN